MLITLNYLISVFAYFFAFLLSKKGAIYKNARLYLLFLATAALLGGITHSIEKYHHHVSLFVQQINDHLPTFIESLKLQAIDDRIWYLTVVAIGFVEFFFIYIFIEPIAKKQFGFLKQYLKTALAFYLLITIISDQYFWVVVFHVLSHTSIIILSTVLYFLKKKTSFLLLAGLVAYNLSIGIIQQLMSIGIMSSGPLHYNDWYHIGVIFFVCFTYALFIKTNLIQDLSNN